MPGPGRSGDRCNGCAIAALDKGSKVGLAVRQRQRHEIPAIETAKYPAIATALRTLPAGQAYLDGELCGVRPDGVTSFALIQNAAERRGGADLVYFVFDLLYLDVRLLTRTGLDSAVEPSVHAIAVEFELVCRLVAAGRFRHQPR
jgi:hypothetical protein